jgi:hypothetical protein
MTLGTATRPRKQGNSGLEDQAILKAPPGAQGRAGGNEAAELCGYGFDGKSLVAPMVVWGEPEHPLETAADLPRKSSKLSPEGCSGGLTRPECGIMGNGLNE